MPPGVTADLDRRGRLLGIEVLDASRHLHPLVEGLARRYRIQASDRQDREFRRLSALLAHRAKRAGIRPEDVDREIKAHRAGR